MPEQTEDQQLIDKEEEISQLPPPPPPMSNKEKYSLLGALIISGFFNTIAYQFQNQSHINEPGFPGEDGSDSRKFFHPYMQAVAMFFGEGICIFLFLGYKTKYKQEYEEGREKAYKDGKKKLNYFMIMLPAFSDACTSTLQHVALVFVSPSIYQIMRGGSIAVIALASVIFLKRKLFPFQWIGAGIVILGISIVGIQSQIFGSGDDGGTASQQAIALIMLILSLFTSAFTYIMEEFLLRKYYLHPFQLVGMEGIWGFLIYMGVFMPFLNLAPCNFEPTACVFAPDGQANYERVQQYFIEMVQDPLLCSMCIIGVFSISVFNVVGVTVTKNISSLTRSVVDQIRTILVWVFSIIITVSGYQKWENTYYGSVIFELIGFCVLLTGQVTYQSILKWPCCPPPQKEEQVQLKEGSDLERTLISDDGLKQSDKNQTAYSE